MRGGQLRMHFSIVAREAKGQRIGVIFLGPGQAQTRRISWQLEKSERFLASDGNDRVLFRREQGGGRSFCYLPAGSDSGPKDRPVIEALNLCKRFQDKKRGEVRAVDGVSFTCRPGEIYGLLGANGAGKTTTLRMLATILEPTEGTARLCGHDVVEHPERVRANCGFLSTATALYPRLTAQEMVEYFGKLNGLDSVTLKKRIDEIFDRLDMNDFRDRRCDKLSTGMKQKTSIARTLVHDPPVMIFDEPTLGLDIMTARTIIEFIRECRERKKTVIFSTHVMREVEKLCDIVGIIQDGRLLAEGTLEQLRQRHGEQDLEEIFVKIVAPHYGAQEASRS
jgi:sodium transport system ATP-binding protein